MIVLYSNHCPRCDILKAKLDEKKIQYEYVDDSAKLVEAGLQDAFFPILEVDGIRMPFMEANNYVNTL